MSARRLLGLRGRRMLKAPSSFGGGSGDMGSERRRVLWGSDRATKQTQRSIGQQRVIERIKEKQTATERKKEKNTERNRSVKCNFCGTT